ncbi:MAG: hypothetical protein COV36_04910 [Alphaproteobacteria bacterium CG11_big_fil_rev_8_21_14_0_20_44_7]|nr:MAG: hypothetical protein COV36_04910 [Alphaproteobacteria bacterium CG11_big_fil_rev_8_21_14_0_20_44_7]
MLPIEKREITDFKTRHADLLAWLYYNLKDNKIEDESRENFRKSLLNFAAIMDSVRPLKTDSPKANLIRHINHKANIKSSDMAETDINNIFADDEKLRPKSWVGGIASVINIDLGKIEEIIDEIIDGLKAIYTFVMTNLKTTLRRSDKLLQELSMIIEDIKKIRSNTPLLVELQTQLEMEKSSSMAIA